MPRVACSPSAMNAGLRRAPRGDYREGWNGDRYCAFYGLDAWRRYMSAANFIELAHYYRPPGRPLEQQPRLATMWLKPIR